MVVANDITKEGAGFNTDTNIATILTKTGESVELPLM
jgi:phosphopantothenoylcysteine decarboxylase/phosphopantothenate--cysteine ligase